jgi:hypothetical protein
VGAWDVEAAMDGEKEVAEITGALCGAYDTRDETLGSMKLIIEQQLNLSVHRAVRINQLTEVECSAGTLVLSSGSLEVET